MNTETLLLLAAPVAALLIGLLILAVKQWLTIRTSEAYNEKLFLRARTLQTERDAVKHYLAANGRLTIERYGLLIRAIELQQPKLLEDYPELLKAYHKANK